MACPSGKTGMSHSAALRLRDRLKNKTLQNLSVYRCPSCHRWHLTSQPQGVAS